jgi:hypothetical protein
MKNKCEIILLDRIVLQNINSLRKQRNYYKIIIQVGLIIVTCLLYVVNLVVVKAGKTENMEITLK